MAKWYRSPRNDSIHADLGHGLELVVWWEAFERLPLGAPAYNVSVFGPMGWYVVAVFARDNGKPNEILPLHMAQTIEMQNVSAPESK